MSELNVDTNLIAEVAHRLGLRDPNRDAVRSVVSAASQHFDVEEHDGPFECIVDSATGVGKTYVLAGLLEYFAGRENPARNFLLLAPGKTIRDKSINNFTPGHRKSITAALKSQPVVITSENFNSPESRAAMEDSSRTKLYVFTVQALTSKTGEGRATHEYQEFLGGSFFEWLSNCDDLVIFADEQHCYRGPAFSKTIVDLNPEVVVGLTATPDKKDSDLIVYLYPLARAIRDKHVKTPVLVARKDDRKDEKTKLLDGLNLLRHKETLLERYCTDNGYDAVNPVMLVIAPDTRTADELRNIIDSESFDGGYWVGKTLLVHSNLKGDEKEASLAALDAVEDPESPVRIIISVGMLKEGWDVKNVYVIASFRASVSDILTEQTLGRGMRLPFGAYTGERFLDTVEVIAHERYQDLLKKRDSLNQQFVNYEVWFETRTKDDGHTEAVKKVVDTGAVGEIIPRPTAEGSTSTIPDPDAVADTSSGILDLEAVVDAAGKDAEKAKTTAHEHLPVHGRAPIPIPVIVQEPVSVSVSLNQIPNLDTAFVDLARAWAVGLSDELMRTELQSTGDTIVAKVAEGFEAARLDKPLAESRMTLINAVMDSEGVPPYATEHGAASRIAESVIAEMGDEAGPLMSAYMPTMSRQIQDRVVELLKSVQTGGVTYTDKVDVSSLTGGRRCALPHQPDQVETYQRGMAYGGWSKAMYEYTSFDSSTEYVVAKAVDAGTAVSVWARLHINDVDITWTSGGRKYNPDFIVVEESDGKKTYWIVETKMNKEMTSEEVQAKKQSAVTWTNTVTSSGMTDGTWKYLLLSEQNVADAHGNWDRMKAMGS
jgi:type III restriction enzyme